MWNKKIENSLVRLGNMSQAYNLLHNRSSLIYRYLNLAIGLTTGVLTSITGILLTIPNYNTVQNNSDKSIILFISAILNFTQQFLSLEKHSSLHTLSAKKYQIIYNNICTQLSLYKKDRLDSQSYLINTATEINNLIVSSPPINPLVVWSFNNIFKRKRINILENNELEDIRVENSSNSQSTEDSKNETEIFKHWNTIYSFDSDDCINNILNDDSDSDSDSDDSDNTDNHKKSYNSDKEK